MMEPQTYLKRHLGGQVELFRQSNIMKQTRTEPSFFINLIIGESRLDDPQTKVEDSVGVVECFRIEMGSSKFSDGLGEFGSWRWKIGWGVWFWRWGFEIFKQDLLIPCDGLPVSYLHFDYDRQCRLSLEERFGFPLMSFYM